MQHIKNTLDATNRALFARFAEEKRHIIPIKKVVGMKGTTAPVRDSVTLDKKGRVSLI